jgi:hypothetical protein
LVSSCYLVDLVGWIGHLDSLCLLFSVVIWSLFPVVVAINNEEVALFNMLKYSTRLRSEMPGVYESLLAKQASSRIDTAHVQNQQAIQQAMCRLHSQESQTTKTIGNQNLR